MKAIVTGCDGFVGSSVVNELIDNGWSVFGVDLSPLPHRRSVGPFFHYFQTSATDLAPTMSELLKFGPFDVFFHLAWAGVSGPGRSDETVQCQNVLMSTKWLRIAKNCGCQKFICSGSIMEFETMQIAYQQGSSPSPSYIYGAGKSAAHEICKSIANNIGISLVWAYITNTYGVGENSPRLINNTLRYILHNQPLEFTEGKQNYDFVCITDVAYAFRLLAEKGLPNKGYVIGSGDAKPLHFFLEEIISLLKPIKKPVFGAIPYTGYMTPLSSFDISELKKDCDYSPKISFSEGILKTYNWLAGERF